MLDLKNLEEKLDKALESETKESLTEWLLSIRGKDFTNAGGTPLGQSESEA